MHVRRRAPLGRRTIASWSSACSVLLYMFVPIVVVVLMSFNDPAGRAATQFDGFTLRQLAQHLRARRLCSSLRTEHRDRPAGDPRGDPARHPDGLRDGPALLPRAGRGQPADLPADGDARDRDGLLAAGAVRQRRLRRRAGLLDHLRGPRDVLPVLRRGDREGPAGRPGPAPGAGGDGPLRQRVADVLAGHASRWSSRASSRRRCWRSRCRSTTSSSRTSTPGRR